MSVIRKKPYIEALLASMTTANLKDLRTVLNTGGDNVSLDFAHLNAATYKNKVTPVYFKFEDNGLKTGILIWTNTMCALICYHRFQDLIIFELSPTYHTSKKINEYCDINELRRVLDDTVESTGAIDSGSAAEGALPFADGNGGVGWDKPVDYIKGSDFPEGTTSVKMIAIDDDGDLVKVDIPEGTVVVDSALSDSSENPVQNKVINAALISIEGDITDLQGDVSDLDDTKANKDGNYPTMTVGMADNLTPYDESAGDDQDEPFSFQATGTANGSQADFATGSNALMKEKQGNSVVVNQLVQFSSGTYTESGITFTKNSNGTITVSGIAEANVVYSISIPEGHNGHKGLFLGSTAKVIVYNGITTGIQDITNNVVKLLVFNGTDLSTPETITPCVIDLTQWYGFNDNIPANLLAHPENWYRYYKGSLAYNTGELVNANSRYIKCIGRNQWDEEWELGDINTDTGEKVSGDFVVPKDFISVIPNTDYYWFSPYGGIRYFYGINKEYLSFNYAVANSMFTTPNNCYYILFREPTQYGTTYNNDITISLYYEGESGYDQYYPYKVLTNNDTGTEVLRSAGTVRDSKAPNGTITRRIGTYTFTGSESWTVNSGYAITTISDLSGKLSSENIIIEISQITKCEIDSGNTNVLAIYLDTTIYDTSAKINTLTSGKVMNYELANPTTEQGTPFSENLVIDDFGSMEFSGTSGVPQGNLIFYPVDYKAFIDTLYDYTEGTPSDIQLKSDLSTAITTFLTGLTGYDATKTQVLKNVEGTLTWVDEEA